MVSHQKTRVLYNAFDHLHHHYYAHRRYDESCPSSEK